MAKSITRGFSLVETQISLILLVLLVLTLLSVVTQLQKLSWASQTAIEHNWQRLNLSLGGISTEQLIQNGDVNVSSTFWRYIDTNEDGIADAWHQVLTPSTTSVDKTVIHINLNNQTLNVISY